MPDTTKQFLEGNNSFDGPSHVWIDMVEPFSHLENNQVDYGARGKGFARSISIGRHRRSLQRGDTPSDAHGPDSTAIGGCIVSGLQERHKGRLHLSRGAAHSFNIIGVPTGAALTDG